jgi:hypothetical protein
MLLVVTFRFEKLEKFIKYTVYVLSKIMTNYS